jgi:hypothetical protein
MRAVWVLSVIVGLVVCAACGAPAAPKAAGPKGPTPCARASDNMVQALLERLSKKGPVPAEEADALRNLIRERCEQDGWSAEATRCLIARKKVEDTEACAPLLTEAQQEALVSDQSARLGGPAGDPADPAKAGKPNDNATDKPPPVEP